MNSIKYLKKINNIVISLTLITSIISCKNELENHPTTDTTIDNENTIITTPLFTQVSEIDSGVSFINYNKENNDYNYYSYEYFYNGGGVATADFNNDGLLDIVFTANMALNKIYINRGNFKFEDITSTAGINSSAKDWCTGVNVIDINNDGYQDIFISRAGWFENEEANKLRNLLFINNGDLTFTEKGEDYGFKDNSRSTQACFFDKDNDGDLDVYIINHPKKFTTVRKSSDGSMSFIDENATYSDSDKLYENNNGKFTDITKSLNLQNVSHSLGIRAADLNNDGWQDLYIANDYSKPDDILINQKNGTFKNERNSVVKHMSKFSMGVDIADINNDGLVDIFNSEMLGKDNYSKKVNMASMNPELYEGFIKANFHYQDMHNSLQLNNGNGTFSEISWMANVAETDWSWSPLFADFDNDGLKDLFVSNGYKRDVLNKDFMRKSGKEVLKNPKIFDLVQNNIPVSKSYNYIFKNNGDLTYNDNSKKWGLKDVALNTNGAAYADLDNDGDLDLVLNNIEERAIIYKNNNIDNNNFLTLDLIDNSKIPYGVKVSILDHGKQQFWELGNTSGFQSHSDTRIHFGLGKSTKVDSIVINWPTKGKRLYTSLKINNINKVKFSDGIVYTQQDKKISPLLTNVTNQISISDKHKELEYDDYKKEILLPQKMSQEGPFIDVADINGDGLEDFYQGNGSGFAGVLYIQKPNGKFYKSRQNDFEKDKMSEDIGVLFFDYDNDGDKDLYVVSGSNEYEINSPQQLDRLYNNDGLGNFSKTINVIPNIYASGSCVKTADIDNDGDLDLFIGGFQVPHKYPQPGESQLLINNEGVFTNEIISRADGLNNIGMVKDAIFTDINNDKQIDLIVVGHWMPIEIYINVNGVFKNNSEEYNTKENVGWWNTITTADLNNDGTLELIAGNLGTNSKHKATKEQPFVVMAKDFDGNGTNDIALGYYNNNQLYPVRGLQCSSEQLPGLKENIHSYAEFGSLTFDDIYKNYDTSNATTLKATYFESSVLYNINGKFKFEKLPNQTQMAPTNGILINDLDLNKTSEILTIGNFYPVEIETGRSDAHIGSILTNELKPIPLIKTGFFNDGDARDIKSITINGVKHIMISNNRASIEFFRIE
ncbi:hypothetical protein ULMA_27020 [Patiriisocius marinus]|uniref:ASPIC/UnbV domain-containing protein n=1 Tax=Patiriisocius marinus TaxID=1397112 RepID=A0A5J4IZV4_9FLAO|nr:VCBS repeat-containing protein [Patiriisocius marinus]GER60594.1 hypothetical protein ULMA_27020 [Patiriisocius marinus]